MTSCAIHIVVIAGHDLNIVLPGFGTYSAVAQPGPAAASTFQSGGGWPVE